LASDLAVAAMKAVKKADREHERPIAVADELVADFH
jgi:hypothetical protein